MNNHRHLRLGAVVRAGCMVFLLLLAGFLLTSCLTVEPQTPPAGAIDPESISEETKPADQESVADHDDDMRAPYVATFAIELESVRHEDGYTGVVTWLDEHGGVNQTDETGATPLHHSAVSGNVALTGILLHLGANPAARQQSGYTPLHFACAADTGSSHRILIDQLVQYGAEVDVAADNGATPLHVAAFADSADSVDRLLFHGANPAARDSWGIRPIDYDTEAARSLRSRLRETLQDDPDLRVAALRFGVESLPSVLDQGIEAWYQQRFEDDLFGRELTSAGLLYGVDQLPIWLDEHGGVSRSNGRGETHLHYALLEGDRELVELLLDNGADPNATDNQGLTPLHWYATLDSETSRPDLIDLMVKYGAGVEIASATGLTPLHVALFADNHPLARRLIRHGADWTIPDQRGVRPYDYDTRAAETLRNRIGDSLELQLTLRDAFIRFGDEVLPYVDTYGSSALQAYYRLGVDAFKLGRPEAPPNGSAVVSVPRAYEYVETPQLELTVRNTGRGPLFDLRAEITYGEREENGFVYHTSPYIGYIAPGEESTVEIELRSRDYLDQFGSKPIVGTEIPVEITFTELNGYEPWPSPDPLRARISVIPLDDRSVLRRPELFSTSKIRQLVERERIGRFAIDRLIHFGLRQFSMEDVFFFAEKRAISQDIVERIILEGLIRYTPDAVVRLASLEYVSRSVVESLYLNSSPDDRYFNPDQVEQLVELGVFRAPQIGYTYLVDDSNQHPTDPSDGVPDGRIQIREAVLVTLAFKNDSVFNLGNVAIGIESPTDQVDLFADINPIALVPRGSQFETSFELAVKPQFDDDEIDLRITMESDDFGRLFETREIIPVGRDVGDPVISISKRVASTSRIDVHGGASGNTPVIATLEEGAVFEAVGYLDGYYRVRIFGDHGWIAESSTRDHTDGSNAPVLASSISREERLFSNMQPVVVIKSPGQYDQIDDNHVELRVEAIDQSRAISSIAVWVNGSLLPGSTERGLRVAGRSQRVERSFHVSLAEGKNEIVVAAYNEQNVASDEQSIVLYSSGIANPPELYLLAVGVNDYQDPDWNLRYAASDAETIDELFRTQTGGLYEKVHTRVLTNQAATRQAIITALNEFVYRARRQDVVLIFLAGHGVESNGIYYFLPHDGDPDRPVRAGISQEELYGQLIANIDTAKAVVMLDTCQSGFSLTRAGRRGTGPDLDRLVERLAGAEGIMVMSASRSNQAAQEREEWGHGAFTLAIEEALRGGAADDRNGNGAVDLFELQAYLENRVFDLTDGQQKPNVRGENIENFPIFAH